MTVAYRKNWDTYFMDIACMVSLVRVVPAAMLVLCWCRVKVARDCLQPGRRWGFQIARKWMYGFEQYEREVVDGTGTMVMKQRCVRTIHEQNLLLFPDATGRQHRLCTDGLADQCHYAGEQRK
jgi:dCMP deaminase